MRSTVLSFGLLVCAACGASQRPQGADPSGPLVLLRPNTVLRTAPNESAPWLRLAPRAELGDVLVFRRVERQGAWLGVQPESMEGNDQALHCGDISFALAPFGVTFWVPVEALVPVLSVPFEQHTEDGTSVVLRVGTPLEPGRNGHYNYTYKDWTFEVDVPPRSVATSFAATALLEPLRGEAANIRVGQVLHYLNDRSTGNDTPTPTNEAFEVEDATREGIHGDEVLVGLQNHCARLIVRTPNRNLAVGALGGLGAIGSGFQGNLTLRAGAPLFWPDGRSAGNLRTPVRTSPNAMSALEPQRGIVCFRFPVSYPIWLPPAEPEQVLQLCVRPEDTSP